ncbi:hypothetical protein [Shimazuella alba]|uniref:Uncharacterized protein n=1 Tax=Shimazuella alba TaxID=2690964 RepID=A0A6I4VX99_9BACL|nr:hypothetical protein [Shimazuella alba]MXQ55291.1 hypothetical protein [Shimazuella alba]
MNLKERATEAYKWVSFGIAKPYEAMIPKWIKEEIEDRGIFINRLFEALDYIKSSKIDKWIKSLSLNEYDMAYIKKIEDLLLKETIPTLDSYLEDKRIRKLNERDDIYPGVRRFLMPYWPRYVGCIQNDDGYCKMLHLWVEVHVGRIEDLKENRLLTILITEPNARGFANHVEHICTQIRYTYIPRFTANHKNIKESQIRWVSVQGEVMDWNGWSIDHIVWNEKLQKYDWSVETSKRIDHLDWPYLESMIHFQNTANTALKFIDLEYKRLKHHAPIWLKKMMIDVTHELSQEQEILSPIEEVYRVMEHISKGDKTSNFTITDKIVHRTILSIPRPLEQENYTDIYNIKKALEQFNSNTTNLE